MQGTPIPTPQSIGAQPFDDDLQAIAALTPTAGGFLVGTGSTWAVQSGLNARAELGGTTVGQSFFTLSNPGITSFPLISSSNTVSTRTATQYRGDLGLGTLATQAASSVAITGGTIAGITDLAVADGGTGASTASGARTNLELGTAATVNTGTTSGTIPVLTTGGLLDEARLPGAGLLRAWVRFDVVGGVVTIDGSSNVASISIQATGQYRINFTNALANTNYAAFATKQNIVTNNSSGIMVTDHTTTYVEILNVENNALAEAVNISVGVFY